MHPYNSIKYSMYIINSLLRKRAVNILFIVIITAVSLLFLIPSTNEIHAQDICDGYENYFDNFGFGQDNKLAQTFTPAVNHAVDYIDLMLSISYFETDLCDPGLVKVRIESTDTENRPNGEVLAQGSVEGGIITGDAQVIRFEMDTCTELSAGTLYAIVASAEDADSVGCVRWWIGDIAGDGGYVDGQLWSYTGNWSAEPNYDAYFLICGPSQCPEMTPVGSDNVCEINDFMVVLPWIAISEVIIVLALLLLFHRKQSLN
jgi:hypothetical protein